ncbi:RHS repeat-associated core domain-containing protein [Stenotrophomonas maltophilia]|nr:RHS repeat-associated core domain-containing protein [Stenotrophomonas maltophilia]
MNAKPCFKALSWIGMMRRFGRTAGGVSTRFGAFEGRTRKLGVIGAWLCCLLLMGLGLSPSAIAQTTITYIHTDALGSVVAESDANGNVIKRYDYEPYGAVVGGQVTDGPGYAGHVSDSATGLSYMQQRYMDPQLGVFLSVDPVTAHQKPVEQFNRYRYANGNPYRFVDADGRQAAERFVEQHRRDIAAGNGAVYEPMRPAAIAVTAAMAAPVLIEAGMVAMANPSVISAATSIAADIAGVTGAGGAGVAASNALSVEGRALLNSRPVGSALKADAGHNSATFMRETAAEAGVHTPLTGGDGVVRTLTQLPGELNGKAGRFEYIVDKAGDLTHQRFVEGGSMNGIPNKK